MDQRGCLGGLKRVESTESAGGMGFSRALRTIESSRGMPISTWRRLQFRNPPDVERRSGCQAVPQKFGQRGTAELPEKPFGWMKSVGPLRKVKLRGRLPR